MHLHKKKQAQNQLEPIAHVQGEEDNHYGG